MKFLDRQLQRWRLAKVRPYVASGARVLDIGCADGTLFRSLEAQISEGIGIDPLAERVLGDGGKIRLIAGKFPEDMPRTEPFDVITMLAVFEHIPPSDHGRVARACRDLLRPGGYLIMTVPSPLVDHVLKVLMLFRLVDGMDSLEQHYGFDTGSVAAIFSGAGLKLLLHRKFQLGLNNLFVFIRV